MSQTHTHTLTSIKYFYCISYVQEILLVPLKCSYLTKLIRFCSIWFSNFYQFSSIVFHFDCTILIALYNRRNWDIKWTLNGRPMLKFDIKSTYRIVKTITVQIPLYWQPTLFFSSLTISFHFDSGVFFIGAEILLWVLFFICKMWMTSNRAILKSKIKMNVRKN